MVDMSVAGPPKETEYYLYQPRVERDKYHDVACSITRCVLDISSRRASEIRVMGTIPVLKAASVDEEALSTLCEAGFTVTDEQLDGRVASSEEAVDAVLSLYGPGLHHAHFFDSDGYGIAARYDDTLQHYWLPASAYPELKEAVEPDVHTALLTIDELEEITERKQKEGSET